MVVKIRLLYYHSYREPISPVGVEKEEGALIFQPISGLQWACASSPRLGFREW